MSSTKNLTPENLKEYWGGTGNYYRWSSLFRFAIITDGAKFVSENGCGWLIDLICSHQKGKVRQEPFQVWMVQHNPLYRDPEIYGPDDTLKIKGMQLPTEADPTKNRYMVVCEDGNGNMVTFQYLEYTDFPFENFTEEDPFALWGEWSADEDGKPMFVIYLPVEH